MEEIKGIVFDLGGVLFTEGKKVAAEKLFREKGYDKDTVISSLKTPKSLDLRAGLLSDKEFWNYLQSQLPDGYDAQTIKNYWYDGYQLDKGVLEVIKILQKNYKLLVFSGNIKSRVEYLDKKFSFRKYFTVEIYSYEYHLNKPQKEFIKILIDKSKLKPKQLIYIDDDPKMLKVAESFGIKTVLYQTGKAKKLKEDLKRSGVNI